MTDPTHSRSGRSGSKSRKRDPVTLDLKATEVESRPSDTDETSLTDDPRTPADLPERDTPSGPSLVEDPRTPEDASHPTPSEIEAAVAQLAPDAVARPVGSGGEEPARPSAEPEAAADADLPPTVDVGASSTPHDAAAASAADAGAPDHHPEPTIAAPAGVAADRLHRTEAAAARAITPERRRAGFGALLAASLLGGVAGAALALAAERFWLARPSAARIAQIEQRLALPAPAPDLSGIERRLAALENQQRDQARQLQAAQSAAEQASQRADEALTRPTAGAAAAQPATGDPAALEPVQARLAALESELQARARQTAQQAEDRSGELRARFDEQAKAADALKAEVRALGQALDTATSQAGEQRQRVADVAQQTGQLRQQIESLSKQFSERAPETTAGLRIVAADRILDALRDGAPYAQALAALKRLNAEPQRLAALEPFAQSGAPTAALLAQEFRPLGERIIAEGRGPATSWQDRLARMAEGIVTVRPLGDPATDTAPGLVARIQNALARGALSDAAKAWDALPEPARRTGEEFGRKLKARAAAEDAARAVSNQALAALDASTR
ncbi:MAG TPA: hypothetical protein VE443_05270 [Beijerinckiaceae bacterium]|nr:hypothetical protein [Beijerinckiaceae bacterium]